MYFEVLLRLGVLGALIAMAVTESWLLLGWAAVMLIYFWIQHKAPIQFSEQGARDVFGCTIMMQCMLSIAAAVVFGHAGLYLIAGGMIANTAVVMTNGQCMPYIGDEESNACYYAPSNKFTRLRWLCDIFPTTVIPEGNWCVSVGDALECIGVWALAAEIWVAWL